MACELERPSPQELFDRYLNMFSNTVLGGAEVIPESNEWYATSVNYAIAEQFYAISEQAWKERDPRFACCENLVAMAAVNGVYPRPAVFAQGFVKLTGTPGAVLPTPLEFAIGGANYVTAVASQQPTEIGGNGTAVVRVRSLIAGEVGNAPATSGFISQNIVNVDREVEICGGAFCNGAAAESCDAFRARYLRRLSYQPRATSVWIKDKLLEWPCATRAISRAGTCCVAQPNENGDCTNCDCTDCGGKLEFYLMFDNSFPCGIAPTSVIEEASQWMFGSPQGYGLGQVEVGICGRIYPVTGIPVNIFLDVAACVTPGQLQQVRALIGEYFTTLEPSKPLLTRTIEGLLATTLGAATNYSVRFELVNPSDSEFLFISPCEAEPVCDYLMCLNEITIIRPDPIASC